MAKVYEGPERRDICDDMKRLKVLLIGNGTPGGALMRIEESHQRIDHIEELMKEIQMSLVGVPAAILKVWSHEAIVNKNESRWEETYADVKVLVGAFNKIKGLGILLTILSMISIAISIAKSIK
jgi:hypothetical protein